MLVGRRVEFVEVYEIDWEDYYQDTTIRDADDFCARLMMDADPVLTQQIKCGNESAKHIKLKSRTLDKIGTFIYPVPETYLEDRFDLPKTCVEENE